MLLQPRLSEEEWSNFLASYYHEYERQGGRLNKSSKHMSSSVLLYNKAGDAAGSTDDTQANALVKVSVKAHPFHCLFMLRIFLVLRGGFLHCDFHTALAGC